MALSCDSCEVGPLRDADGEALDSEVVLLVVLPLGPDVPLFPFPLSWLLLPGTKLLGLGRPTLLTLSQLTERLRPVLPRVRGGGGFNGTVGEVLLLEPILEPIPPLDVVAGTQHLKKRLFFSIKDTVVHGRTGSVICRVWSKMRTQDPLLKSYKGSEDNESRALSQGCPGRPTSHSSLKPELGTDKINWEDRK